jgi:hypothetical protein
VGSNRAIAESLVEVQKSSASGMGVTATALKIFF